MAVISCLLPLLLLLRNVTGEKSSANKNTQTFIRLRCCILVEHCQWQSNLKLPYRL